MGELGRISPVEANKNRINIAIKDGALSITSPQVNLSSEREPLRFKVTLDKVPTPVEEGSEIYFITLNRNGERLQNMLNQARSLKDLPGVEKPRKLLSILRSNIQYAYDEVLDEVAETNPKLAKWVAENTGLNSVGSRVTISEVAEKGYGICGHLAVAMLVLAKEAGMEGALCGNSGGSSKTDPKYLLKNVVRKDNGERLFKMDLAGEPIFSGHIWVELKTNGGEWIPVDPTTQLVGDTKEGLEIFREANYRTDVFDSLRFEGFPLDVWGSVKDFSFLPGQASHTGIMEIMCIPRQKLPWDDENEPWPKPTSYQGPLNVSSFLRPEYGLAVAFRNAEQISNTPAPLIEEL